ncbi:MAG: hypothetical protein R3E87_09705 [Burkholderiaceae bacterium]
MKSIAARVTLLTAILVLAACGSIGRKQHGPVAAPPAQRTLPDGTSAKSSAGARGGGLNLVGRCTQREIDGFAEDANIHVSNGEVRELNWLITIGKRGSCRFRADQFRQTRTSPTVEMLARDGSGCKLMMWGDPRRITLAHAGCATYCSKGIYDKAWPVMFDPLTGRCADAER